MNPESDYTPFHTAYYAHELTKRNASDNIAKLGPSLLGATVDLNPHHLDAALFAFRSPLSRGVILADEVGLGKTIEAGLVVSQLWAERKRHILVIAPTILRKQWAQELLDKFPCPRRSWTPGNTTPASGNPGGFLSRVRGDPRRRACAFRKQGSPTDRRERSLSFISPGSERAVRNQLQRLSHRREFSGRGSAARPHPAIIAARCVRPRFLIRPDVL